MNNLIYVASAYAGDVKENSERAKRYCVHVINEGGVPIAPHLLFTQFLDDSVPHERKLGLDLGLELLEHCGEVWVFGDISEGMKREIEKAEELNKPIRWFDADCSDITELMELRVRSDYLLPRAVDIIRKIRTALLLYNLSLKARTTHYRDEQWDSLEDDIGEFLKEVHRVGRR